MSSTLISIFIIAIILWIVLRTGTRNARHAMRRLARQTRAVYKETGLFSPGYVCIQRGNQQAYVFVRSLSFLGGRYRLVLRAAWENRLAIEPTTPTAIVQLHQSVNVPGNRSDLINVTDRLGSLSVGRTTIKADSQGFELCSEVNNLGPSTAIHWYEICSKLYELMLADSEPGLKFLSQPQAINLIAATCQVCGISPEAHQTVLCDRCGAPHHAECWEYNGGCAIFGCKATANV